MTPEEQYDQAIELAHNKWKSAVEAYLKAFVERVQPEPSVPLMRQFERAAIIELITRKANRKSVKKLAVVLLTALPLLKPPGAGGSCPHGYSTSGSYCVPREGAQLAVPKPPGGTCPFGWTASGSYCLKSGSGR